VKGQCFGASVLPADHQGEIMDCYGCVHVFISLNGASYFYDFTVKLLCLVNLPCPAIIPRPPAPIWP
jgi:hypothetical protein